MGSCFICRHVEGRCDERSTNVFGKRPLGETGRHGLSIIERYAAAQYGMVVGSCFICASPNKANWARVQCYANKGGDGPLGRVHREVPRT